MQPSDEVLTFLNRLSGVRKAGSGWEARCPCREDDDNQSLSVSQGDDGRVLATCHRGNPCSFPEIVSAAGLKMTEVHAEKFIKTDKLTQTDAYDYVDADGNLVFQVLRYIDDSGNKTFRQRVVDANGEVKWTTAGLDKPLYRLPQVLEGIKSGATIWLAEGEKDVGTLEKLGEVATTSPGGAGKWVNKYTVTLQGAPVKIVSDNDEPGYDHARQAYHELKAQGNEVELLRAPGGEDDLSEFIGKGGALEGLEPFTATGPVMKVDGFTEVAEAVQEIAAENISAEMKKSRIIRILDGLDVEVDDMGRLVTWPEFWREESEDYNWLIPGLLERAEKVMMVAAEGVGKSMLSRQMALMGAAGIHPFTKQRIKPITTLVMEFENPERIVRRVTKKTGRSIEMLGVNGLNIDAHVWLLGQGLDLMTAQGRVAFEARIDEIQPELICICPLYKAYLDPGVQSSDTVAGRIARFLDDIRIEYDCALWIEHHAPLGSMMGREMRPFGSSVWSRWPEFGLTMVPDPQTPFTYKIGQFRGPRDERDWPKYLERGVAWPFEVPAHDPDDQD